MTLEEAGRLGYDLDIAEPDNEIDIPEDAIIPAEGGAFLYKRFLLKPIGIVIPDDLSDDEWLDIFKVLRKLDEAIQWAIGDLVNHAESKWGETYTTMAEITNYSEKSLREYAYVARSVEMSIRMDNLSFGHHQIVAGIKDPVSKKPLKREQRKWLEKANIHGWSIKTLREAISADNQQYQTTVSDDWLFDKKSVPIINKRVQTLWSKARQGDEKARQEVLGIVDEMRKWLDEFVETLADG
jgi:hypothetical protein